MSISVQTRVDQAGPSKEDLCLICGKISRSRFNKRFGEMEVSYLECTACHHLSATFFESESIYHNGAYFGEIDAGWEARNLRILQFIQFLAVLPGVVVSRGSPILDYGSGRGKLVEDLVRKGFNAFGFEPYPNSTVDSAHVLCDRRALSLLPQRPDLVTCIEVLEHIRQPDQTLREILDLLSANGYLLISTGIYESGAHDATWYYLNPVAGHVSIYTERSLLSLMARNDFYPVARLDDSIWLFRRRLGHKRTFMETIYYALSQLRVKCKVKLFANSWLWKFFHE
jgi:2-polyprenyl-3-methyl-5-hydroxy-6-metoxy-1,4-benzoquinol methylase